MRFSRTLLALCVLFIGAMALVILRYDPWIYADAIQNPLIAVPLVGVLALSLGLQATRVIPVSHRAVVLNDERFDRIDPRGTLALLPGVERIGAEIPLDEQRVLSWPVTIFDKDSAEHMVTFGLTWRLVPTSTRPDSERERRVLLMTNEERRRIVLQQLEATMRDVARSASLDALRRALAQEECIEALRERLCQQLEKDALTVDRLHMQRFFPAKPKDETPPPLAREARKWTEERTVHEDGREVHREEVTRSEEILRGLQPPTAAKDSSKPGSSSERKPQPPSAFDAMTPFPEEPRPEEPERDEDEDEDEDAVMVRWVSS
jgi:regulator of protease activity HflC (stomatin/prohibitin superfamily)